MAGSNAIPGSSWANASTGLIGTGSVGNLPIGSTTNDDMAAVVEAMGPDHYVVLSTRWDRGALANAGAVTLARNDGGLVGTITASNSVLGSVGNAIAATLPFDFDPARAQLVVGRPASNLVSLFTLPAGLPFVSGFE